MNVVHRRKIVQRTLFGKMKQGQVYYDAANRSSPLVKDSQKGAILAWNATTGALTYGTEFQNATVIKLPDFLKRQE